jgi:hypothetical protein
VRYRLIVTPNGQDYSTLFELVPTTIQKQEQEV